jgi:hypothetical protein
MTPETLACPYCNTTVRLVRPGGAGQRLRCPRCHELFPYPAGGDGDQEPSYAPSFNTAEPESVDGESVENLSPKRWSNRAVALVIVGIMLAMAAIGFTFAWFTTDFRRQRDQLGTLSDAIMPGIASVAPAQLAALGYLPAGTDAIAGIHVAELLAQPEMEDILRLLRSDRAGLGIARLEQATGLKLEDLDHVVLGLSTQDGNSQIVLIARTRRRYDANRIRAKLHAKRPKNLPGKTLYPIAPDQWQLGGILWCPDSLTLVYGLQTSDLIELPDTPIAGVERFSEPIRRYLTEADMGKGTQAWAVSAFSQWGPFLGLLQTFLGLRDADRQPFSQVRAFCSRLHCGSGVKGKFECTCSNDEGARDFENYLINKGLGVPQLRGLAAKAPRAAALLEEIANSLVRRRDGDRLFVQFSVRTATIERAFARALNWDRAVE